MHICQRSPAVFWTFVTLNQIWASSDLTPPLAQVRPCHLNSDNWSEEAEAFGFVSFDLNKLPNSPPPPAHNWRALRGRDREIGSLSSEKSRGLHMKLLQMSLRLSASSKPVISVTLLYLNSLTIWQLTFSGICGLFLVWQHENVPTVQDSVPYWLAAHTVPSESLNWEAVKKKKINKGNYWIALEARLLILKISTHTHTHTQIFIIQIFTLMHLHAHTYILSHTLTLTHIHIIIHSQFKMSLSKHITHYPNSNLCNSP